MYFSDKPKKEKKKFRQNDSFIEKCALECGSTLIIRMS